MTTAAAVDRLVDSQMPKDCRVCHTSHTRSAWERLPRVGVHADDYERLELRNCHCGNTLAIVTGFGRKAHLAFAEAGVDPYAQTLPESEP